MKAFSLFILLFSMGANAYLHPIFEKAYINAVDRGHYGQLVWSDSNKRTSCKAIELRLKRISELEDEINFVNSLNSVSFDKQIAHSQIRTFILSQSMELYNILFDKYENKAVINLENLEIKSRDLVYVVVAGEVKLYADENKNEDFSFNKGSLAVGLSNYQACLNNDVNLFVIRNCPISQVKDISLCLDKKIEMYSLEIPEIVIPNGPLRRR